MKLVRAGAFAASLLILPTPGFAEDGAIWNAGPITWKSSHTPVTWKRTTGSVVDLDWSKRTELPWTGSSPQVAQGPALPAEPMPLPIEWLETKLENESPSLSPDSIVRSWFTPSPISMPVADEPLKWSGDGIKQAPADWSGNKSAPTDWTGGKRTPTEWSGVPGVFRPSVWSKGKPDVPSVNWSGTPRKLPLGAEVIDVAPRVVGEPPKGEAARSAPAARILPPSCNTCAQATLERPIARRTGLFSHFRKEAVPSESIPVDGFISAFAPASGPRLSVKAEYLLWWVRNDSTPLLATTGSGASDGVIGAVGTQALFGPGSYNSGGQSGARYRASLWVDEEETVGLDASFFFLGSKNSNFLVNSNSVPVISRPVFLLNTNSEQVETVAFPGFSTGSLRINAASKFWGADVNLLKRLCTSDDQTLSLFAGYRHLDLEESLQIQESIIAGADANDPLGTQTTVTDRFATRNQFNGIQFGGNYEQRWNRWFVNARVGVALGVNSKNVEIGGSNIQTLPGQGSLTQSGGLLAARSNIGRQSQHSFSVAPDVSINLGYQMTPHLRGYVGYSFLYWSNVVRPGQQIDRTVDLSFIPNNLPNVVPTGQRRPAVLFQETDFWAHGLNLGLEFVW
ncbi:MAG: BBP7 family outer membrane beta-barrel protein [Planctomycetes bacterium]|nr:BBP7 family outer membrane beta-barrel protein [Planctomycetota bacterium]